MGHLALKSRHQNSWNGPHAESKITLKFKRSSETKDKVIHRNGKIVTLETNCEVKRMFQYWKSRSVQFIFIKLCKFECALKKCFEARYSVKRDIMKYFLRKFYRILNEITGFPEENHWNQIKD